MRRWVRLASRPHSLQIAWSLRTLSVGTFALSDPDRKAIFALDGERFLQITPNTETSDMNLDLVTRDGRRVVFHAPVDFVGRNPTSNCQLFSVDTLGGDLRQLTEFALGGACERLASPSCALSGSSGCSIVQAEQDALTGTIVFYSSCDPCGTNPNGGQIFAMRPDGSGLRQLTRARGRFTDADGALVVELPGPFRSVTRGSACPGATLGKLCRHSIVPFDAGCLTCGDGVVEAPEVCDPHAKRTGCPAG